MENISWQKKSVSECKIILCLAVHPMMFGEMFESEININFVKFMKNINWQEKTIIQTPNSIFIDFKSGSSVAELMENIGWQAGDRFEPASTNIRQKSLNFNQK